MKSAIRKRYIKWLKQRNPVAPSVTLNQKRIFIFPTQVGMIYLVLLLVLFINAVNYKNNLLFMLCFLMVSVFITLIFHTYSNFSGLSIKSGHSLPVYVGDSVRLPVILRGGRRIRYSVNLAFENAPVTELDMVDRQQTLSHVQWRANQRGSISAPRLKMWSIFPMGMIQTWTWIYLDFKGIVYPKPYWQSFKYVSDSKLGLQEDQVIDQTGIDDFRGFKSYTPGDPLKHIAWKQYAKGGELLTKEFEETHVSNHWLDWHALHGIDGETRLQILCAWVLRSHEDNFEYGLKLPTKIIQLGRGDHHRDECLRALALYEIPKFQRDRDNE